jgi:D-alanyl-D-alanine carboxypeptidase
MLTGSDAVWVDHQNVVPEFVHRNECAGGALGMTRTQFTNPAGLDLDGTHYSTAEDMLKLSRAAMNNSVSPGSGNAGFRLDPDLGKYL